MTREYKNGYDDGYCKACEDFINQIHSNRVNSNTKYGVYVPILWADIIARELAKTHRRGDNGA